MQIDYDDRKKVTLNKKILGCPICHSSRYVVLTESIKDKYYHYRELYCHLCNILFSPIHATTPVEIKE